MAALNYNHLRYFWAVAHGESLTRTAERLGVSQSALSIQIKKLEHQVGHPLFERRGKQLVLTEAGHIALQHADAIFSSGDELMNILRQRKVGRRQSLRVGAQATLSRNFQVAFLAPVLDRSDVDLTLRAGSLGDLLKALESHRLDVVLVNLPPARDAETPWIVHPIAEQPVSLVGRPLRVGQRRSLKTLLAREPLILPSVESSIRSGVDALLNRLGVVPRIVAEVDDMAMLRLLARENLGLAVVPPIVVRDELSSGLLVEVVQFPKLVETFYAVTLARRFPNRLLKDLLRDSTV